MHTLTPTAVLYEIDKIFKYYPEININKATAHIISYTQCVKLTDDYNHAHPSFEIAKRNGNRDRIYTENDVKTLATKFTPYLETQLHKKKQPRRKHFHINPTFEVTDRAFVTQINALTVLANQDHLSEKDISDTLNHIVTEWIPDTSETGNIHIKQWRNVLALILLIVFNTAYTHRINTPVNEKHNIISSIIFTPTKLEATMHNLFIQHGYINRRLQYIEKQMMQQPILHNIYSKLMTDIKRAYPKSTTLTQLFEYVYHLTKGFSKS